MTIQLRHLAMTLAILPVFTIEVHGQPSSTPQRLAGEVRAVFKAKCTECHGPDLSKPKGRFGYVLDLGRIASNPEMVIPRHPEQSELWILIDRGEMPPEDSSAGPLSASQKAAVQRWMAGGASEEVGLIPVSTTSVAAEEARRPDFFQRLWRLLGKLHLLVLHFPIALIVAAALAEMHSFWEGNPFPSPSVRFCVNVAAATVAPAAALGWLYAATGAGLSSTPLLTSHRWFGTTAAAAILLAAFCNELDFRRQQRSWRAGVALLMALFVTGLAAHFGGLLTHGGDFLKF